MNPNKIRRAPPQDMEVRQDVSRMDSADTAEPIRVKIISIPVMNASKKAMNIVIPPGIV